MEWGGGGGGGKNKSLKKGREEGKRKDKLENLKDTVPQAGFYSDLHQFSL